MNQPKISFEDANTIAATILYRSLNFNVSPINDMLETTTEKTQKKRGRPARQRTEESNVDADTDAYALDFSGDWTERTRERQWSDNL